VTDVLFTPWRLSYLEGSAPPVDGCLFCVLKDGSDEEALVVHRGATAYVLLNRYPYSNGHVMVTPYAHRASLSAMTVAERAELIELAVIAEGVLRDSYRPDGLNLGMNLGKSAGAGVADHAHLHVVPRWSGDTNFLTVVGGTRTVPEELAQTRARLAPRFVAASKGRGIA
jgi:ATP adenylyltransferase